MWQRIMKSVSEDMRPFNDDLIFDFRKRKIAEIPAYLDKCFKQSMQFFDNQMTYVGYRELEPLERIEYIISNPILRGGIPIRESEVTLMRYEFLFEGVSHYIHIHVPYLSHNRVVYNDTEYFPQFPIVEKGGINRTDNGSVIVKVMRVPMTFGRRESDKCKIKSVSGQLYWDLIVTAKIYQGSRAGKKSERIPLILYHFCKRGFNETMKWYNFTPGEVVVVSSVDENDTKNEYFETKNGCFIRADKEALKDMYKRRVVLSLFKIFNENTIFVPADVMSDDGNYYKTTLGHYIGAADALNKLLCNNANKHLRMTDPLLDLVAKQQLEHIGIMVNDIYDLLYWMFYNIDDLIVTYDPTNLYNKKIGSLDQLMSSIVRDIAHRQYNVINSKQEKLTQKAVSTFCRSASQQATWIGKTQVFRPNPSLYNDNWLLAIGLKRFISLESIETEAVRAGKKSTKVSARLIKAHPSQLIVTSISDIPSSSPVVTGSMNPFCEIDDDGNIIKPPFAEEIEDVFN